MGYNSTKILNNKESNADLEIWSESAFFQNMERRKGRTAVITEHGGNITYDELYQMIQYCSRYYHIQENVGKFSSQRISKRVLALLLCDNSLENLVIYLSCLWSKIPVILLGKKDRKQVGKFVSTFPVEYLWLPIGDEQNTWKKCAQPFDNYSLYESSNLKNDILEISESLALLLPTSGSEGNSKLVMLSYDNIIGNTHAIIEALNIQPDDRAAVMLPLCYSYGLSVVHTHLLVGATLLMPASSMAAPQFWRFMDRKNVTSLAGVPSVYELMRKLKILEGTYVFSDLRILTQAGGALRTETQRYVLDCLRKRERMAHFAIMYGQTEATARLTTFFLEEHEEHLGSVGCVIPEGKLWIDGKNEQGEIFYQGNNVFLGYAQTALDLTKDFTSTCRVLHTGDIGYLDKEGYLYITGRKSRFAKINGYRIGLDELQEDFSKQLDCEMICVSIRKEEQEKIAFYWTEPAVQVSKVEKLLQGDRRLVGSYILQLLEEFPYKENGKVDYTLLGRF